MGLAKLAKDYMLKMVWGKTSVPRGLYDMDRYFRIHGPISFDKKKEGGVIVAKSTDFTEGTIITYGKDESELDKNIKDAILTAFGVPSSYVQEIGLHRVGEKSDTYAIA